MVKNSNIDDVLINSKLYIPEAKQAFPSFNNSTTVLMLSIVETKGEAIEASISLKLKPICAACKAQQSLAPSPQNPTNKSSFLLNNFLYALTIIAF